MRLTRSATSLSFLFGIAACSGAAPSTSPSEPTAPATGGSGASPDKAVLYFEGTVDGARGTMDVVARAASHGGIASMGQVPYGTSSGDVYFHTCSTSFSGGQYSGGVTAINLLGAPLSGLTAVIDSISATGVTLATGTPGATSGTIATYGGVAPNSVNCTSPVMWAFNDASATSFSFSGHASATQIGPMVFLATGAAQTLTVPPGFTSVTAKLWGAGGGGKNAAGSGGGYMGGTLAVSGGQVLTIVVGKAGQAPGAAATSRPYGGGGAGSTGGTWGGAPSGGGRSAIVVAGVDLMTAGGGGGSSDASPPTGGGGGTNGGTGAGTAGAAGGTQSAGGLGGLGDCFGSRSNSGSALQGGDSFQGDPQGPWGAGAGGGGYFGGGAGAYQCGQWGGGGGGSGHAGAGVSSSVLLQASGQTPPNSGDSSYQSGIGRGGNAGGAGGDGLVVLTIQ